LASARLRNAALLGAGIVAVAVLAITSRRAASESSPAESARSSSASAVAPVEAHADAEHGERSMPPADAVLAARLAVELRDAKLAGKKTHETSLDQLDDAALARLVGDVAADVEVREAAAIVLARRGSPESTSALCEAVLESIRHGMDPARRNLLTIVSTVASPAATAALTRALGDAELRVYAARALAKLGTPESVSAVLACAEADPSDAAPVLRALERTQSPDAVAPLRARIESSTSPAVVRAAAAAAVRLGDASVPSMLLARVDDPVLASARSEILDIVASSKGGGARPALLEATEHPDAAVRAAAIRSLGRDPNALARERLQRLAREDADPDVRALAASLTTKTSGTAHAESPGK